jgi:hypothetical protein
MEIVNRVAESDLVLYNLEALWDGRPVAELDLAPFLYEGLILREKDFREHVKAHDWTSYADRHVAVHCSADALVPTWAYMLVAARLHGIARSVALGRRDDLVRDYFVRALEAEDWSAYAGRPVVVKGCGSKLVPVNAYLIATQKLQLVAAKLMFGEPCSSVPLWRRPAEPPARSGGGAETRGAVKPARPA